MVHVVPVGMSELYGLMPPSHFQEVYLTPFSLVWLLLSSRLQEHLGGPETQLSSTEQRLALSMIKDYAAIRIYIQKQCFF